MITEEGRWSRYFEKGMLWRLILYIIHLDNKMFDSRRKGLDFTCVVSLFFWLNPLLWIFNYVAWSKPWRSLKLIIWTQIEFHIRYSVLAMKMNFKKPVIAFTLFDVRFQWFLDHVWQCFEHCLEFYIPFVCLPYLRVCEVAWI